MAESRFQLCTICGEERTAGQVWFLVAESYWEDKLKILQWKDELANRKGIHRACCPAHVQELVAHWMATGSLDCLFATNADRLERVDSGLPIVAEPDITGTRQIGELAVHRESVGRALDENPDSLQIILDELADVLERECRGGRLQLESAAGGLSGWLPHA